MDVDFDPVSKYRLATWTDDPIDQAVSDVLAAFFEGFEGNPMSPAVYEPPPAPPAPSSIPVHTVAVGDDLILSVVRVDLPGMLVSYQLYAASAETWALVGVAGLFADAISEICIWQNYVRRGGTLAAWKIAHPDGVEVQS